jgi:hypothetical protein
MILSLQRGFDVDIPPIIYRLFNMAGVLSISADHNHRFNDFLTWHGLKPGPSHPLWGVRNKNYSYYACAGFDDQINLYRLHRVFSGGLASTNEVMYGDLNDRTGTLKLPFKWAKLAPWKIPSYTDNNFEGLLSKTVSEFLAQNSHISILCSGGVDSVAIVAAFIKFGDKSRFSIAYTSGSIHEYPFLFHFLKINQFKLINLEECSLNDLPGLIVHGQTGGKVFEYVDRFAERRLMEQPWESCFNSEEWNNKELKSLIDFTAKYLEHSGKSNATVADLCVFHSMNARSNQEKAYLHYDTKLEEHRLMSFYHGERFESWVHHHTLSSVTLTSETRKYK